MNDDIKLAVIITEGPEAGDTFVLGRTTFIGSNSSCEICITGAGIAAMQARIALRSGMYVLTDLTRDPDMMVNGRVVKSRPLVLGDKIAFGETVMDVISSAAARDQGVTSTATQQIVVSAVDKTPESPEEAPAKPEIRQKKKSEEPEADAREVMAAIRDKAANAEEEEGSKSRHVIAFVIVLCLLGAITTVLFLHSSSETKKLHAKVAEIKDFAEMNPGESDEVIKRYKALIALLGDDQPEVTSYISAQIVEAKRVIEDEEEEFQKMLIGLDKESDALLQQELFDEAIDVYDLKEEDLKVRVLSFRKEAIDGIKEMQKESLAAIQEEEVEEARLEEQEKRVTEEKFERIMAEVAKMIIASNYVDAIDSIRFVIEDDGIDADRVSLGNVIAEIKFLKLADERDGYSENDDSKMIKVVNAIRNDDLWTAQRTISTMSDHVLYKALKLRTEISQEAIKSETGVLKAYALAWAKLSSRVVKKIPSPSDCILALEKAADAPEKEEDLVATCEALLQCQKDFKGDRFVEAYADVFMVARRMRDTIIDLANLKHEVEEKEEEESGISSVFQGPEVVEVEEPVIKTRKSSFNIEGDGYIDRIEGNTYYVTLRDEISQDDSGAVGLFSVKHLFLEEKKNPRCKAIKIHTLVPFKYVDVKQVKFTLPGDMKGIELAVKDHVLLGGNLELGEELLQRSDFLAYLKNNQSTVLGFTKDMRKVAVLKCTELDSDWARIGKGQMVYFVKWTGVLYDTFAIARVEKMVGAVLICSILTHEKDLDSSCQASMTPSDITK